MNKSLKKILVAGASLLMFASVGAGASSMTKSVHAIAYTEQHTGTLTHSVRFGRHFYRKGSPVYGAQSLGNPTKMYVYLGHDTVDQRLIPDSYYTNAMHLHHYHHHHHRKVLYQYQIRPHYSNKTYKRLFKRLVHEMEAHGMHYDSSNETGRLNHKGRYIELTGTNTGVVTNGLRALWPDQALNLLHIMYRRTPHHYYRPVRRHYRRHAVTKRHRKAVRKARVRRHARKAHKHIHRTRKVGKQSNRHRHSLQDPIKRNCYELNQQTLRDINRDRRRYHLRSLKVDGQLNQIGSQRSHQLQHYFSHNTPQHADEVQYLLDQKHVNYEYYGENIVSSPLGTISMVAVGRYDNPNDASHNRLIYHAHNGYQLANNIEDASMNHDEGDQNGHRDNILDKQFKRIGVGSSYDLHDGNYYAAVEFTD